MHAFLIIGGSKDDRVKKISTLLSQDTIKPYDIRTLELTSDMISIGIKVVREWQKQLMLMPHASPYTAGVITSAELLTTEPQNALLKTLEEPPTHARIYMEASSDGAMLPTVVSRCQIIYLQTMKTVPNNEQIHMMDLLRELTNSRISAGHVIQRLDANIKNKDEANTWIQQAILVLHQTRTEWPKLVYSTYIKRLLKGVQQLSSNVSYKLVIDHIFLPTKH